MRVRRSKPDPPKPCQYHAYTPYLAITRRKQSSSTKVVSTPNIKEIYRKKFLGESAADRAGVTKVT